MNGNGNGNGNGKILDPPAVSEEVLYYVYHEEERRALEAMGFDVQTARDFEPQSRHVVILTGLGDLYAVGKAPGDGEFAYRHGAVSVRVAKVPTMRGTDLVTLLSRGVLDREWIEAEAVEAGVLAFSPPSPIGTDGRIIWSAFTDEELGMRLASSVKPKRIEWLMPDRIPALAYTLIAGEGKQGKSQFTMAMGALLSTGGEWWDGCGPAPRGHVLYLSAEDDAERVIRPRLEALGADLDMVTILEARFKKLAPDGKELVIDGVAELGNLAYWREVFGRVKDPLVIFVDPLPSYIGRGVNDRKNSDVRAVLGPFIALAVEFGITVVGVTHLGKSIDPGKPLSNRVLDSIAYTNLARAIHFVARDPANHDRKFFLPGPSNWAPGELDSLAFKIVERQVTTEDGVTLVVAVAEVEANTVAVRPEDVVSAVPQGKPGRESKVQRELALWLVKRLRDENGQKVGLLFNEAAEAFADRKPNPMGLKDPATRKWSNTRTLHRAADNEVPSLPYPDNGWKVDKYQFDGKWYWRLIKQGDEEQGCIDAQPF